MTRVIATIAVAFALSNAYAHATTEDDASWDCRIMGDRVCGVNNAQHVTPGLYDAHGTLIDPTITTCHLEIEQHPIVMCP